MPGTAAFSNTRAELRLSLEMTSTVGGIMEEPEAEKDRVCLYLEMERVWR